MKFLIGYERMSHKLNKYLFWAMSIVLIFMSLMLFTDVVARYIIRKQTSFGYDLNLWLTIVLAFLGGGYAIQTKEHIVVDVLYAKMSEKTKAIVNIASGLMALILAGVLIVIGFQQTMTYFERGSVAMSGFNIHIWIKWAIVPIGGLLLAIQGLLYEMENVFFLVTGKNLSDISMGNSDDAAIAIEKGEEQ